MLHYIIIIIIILLIIYKIRLFDIKNLNYINYDDLDNGDIIICSYDHTLNPLLFLTHNLISSIATGGVGTHCGLVVKINEKRYIYHMYYGPTYDHYTQTYLVKKPILECLDNFYKTYEGTLWVHKKKCPNETLDVIDFIDKTHETNFSINQLLWINTIFKFPYKSKDKICTDLVKDYVNYFGGNMGEHQTPQDLEDYLSKNEDYYNECYLLSKFSYF